ncbi:MAG: protein kinase [Verrucomicrobiae bacterium]|nr:protein kinase [Verrucomicrobiae bacterium]
MSATCPATEQLAAALRGNPSPATEAELAAHLAECPVCQRRLEELAGGSGWLDARAKAHATADRLKPASLDQAMRALESQTPGLEREAPSPPTLDFLLPSDQPGALGRFGPYEVLALVAAGGMGIVLKAHDPGLNRIVALKILPPALAANSLARARFIREARAAAAVVHEHVVPIYAVDEFAGLPYLVMQFIVGRTLAERIKASGRLRLEEILRIGAQTADGLAAAHAQGLIHRDVKPGNVLLENGVERVKLTDFGLARAMDDSSLSREGYIAGTPEYMSPEQANGQPVDVRADLFSFGCVLYEMATGISPFRAEKPLVAMRRVCDEEPPAAHTLNSKIPEWLGQLIQRLMAKDAAARPQTAAEVATELGRRLAALQQGAGAHLLVREAPVSPTRRLNPLLWPAWAAVLALTFALVWVAFLKPKPESAARDPSLATPANQSSALFVIPATGDTPEQGFASLADAIAAARDGAVIECHFNGRQRVAMVRGNEKALILRAGEGFAPILVPATDGEMILFTHAPLVLEGLTLFTQSMLPPGTGRRGDGNHGRGAIMIVEDAPFLAAHCRIEVATSTSTEFPTSSFLSLVSTPAARFFHCEFACGETFALGWRVRPRAESRESADHLWMQESIAVGNLILVSPRGRQPLRLDLAQNTLSGESPLAIWEPFPGQPLQVIANANVFSVDTLVNPIARASSAAPETLLRWQGRSNVYSVQTFARFSPAVNGFDDWLASSAVAETNSLSAQLGVRARLTSLTERTRETEAAALALTAEELERLKAQGWTSPQPPGADPQKTGPGKPYHEWRKSPAYAEWLKLVREHVPQIAAGR